MAVASPRSLDQVFGTFDTLIAALRQAAVDAPGWHLTSAHRWQLMRDTLLGHVRVRGAIRPRDLPLDTSCQKVIDASICFLSLPPYRFETVNIQFRHWLAMFALLQMATSEACEACPISEDDLLCATIIELCFASGGRVLRKAADVASLPCVQRLIGVLGLSQQEWDRLIKGYQEAMNDQNRSPKHDAILARWAAGVVVLEDPPRPQDYQERDAWRAGLAERLSTFEGKRPEIQAALAILDERASCYVTLKAQRPQRYINRGTRHWLLRGASAWCSQSLALARDLLCDDHSLLFSDSDAIIGMWFPRSASQAGLQKQLDEKLASLWKIDREAGGLARRFPRLGQWLGESLPEGGGINIATNLPSLSAWCREPLSALEIALYRLPEPDKKGCPAADDSVPGGSCTRVTGDSAVSFRRPCPWLQDEELGQEGSAGITSMIWALCGTAFRTHTHEGLCKALSRPDLYLQNVKHGHWLQQLGMSDESLVHLKLDGTGVGDRFRKHSLADFPWLSMQLARMLQHRLVAGVRSALEHSPPADGKEGGPTLPVDVVYVGGDDVYVILPEPLLQRFLEGFGGWLPDIEGNPWKDTAFTFVAACLEPKEKLLYGIEEPRGGAGSEKSNRLAAANLAAARVVTEGLDAVKKDVKGEAPCDPVALQRIIDESLKVSNLSAHAMRADMDQTPLGCGRDLGDGRRLMRGRRIIVGRKAAVR